jgi:hypothetical protein
LVELGVGVQQLPSLKDPSFLKCSYWTKDKIPFDFRIQFSNYLREKALQDSRGEQLSAASKSFGTLMTIFPKSLMDKFSSEQQKTRVNFIVISKSNYLKCLLMQNEYPDVINFAHQFLMFFKKNFCENHFHERLRIFE